MKFPVLSWISSFFFVFDSILLFCHFFLHSRNDNSDNFSCVADDHNVDDDKEKVELGQDHLRKSSGDKKVVHNWIDFFGIF